VVEPGGVGVGLGEGVGVGEGEELLPPQPASPMIASKNATPILKRTPYSSCANHQAVRGSRDECLDVVTCACRTAGCYSIDSEEKDDRHGEPGQAESMKPGPDQNSRASGLVRPLHARSFFMPIQLYARSVFMSIHRHRSAESLRLAPQNRQAREAAMQNVLRRSTEQLRKGVGKRDANFLKAEKIAGKGGRLCS
jgi:hypothetical protein